MKIIRFLNIICITMLFGLILPAQESGNKQKSITVEAEFTIPRGGSIPIALVPLVYPLAIDRDSDPDDRFNFIKGYSDGYKFALIKGTYPKNFYSDIDQEKSPYAEGYRKGRAQGFDDNLKYIYRCGMEDFGYERVILKGKFTFGFEESIFTTSKGEKYCVDFATGFRKKLPKGRKLTVTGYLSQKGAYGTVDCSQEFVVIGSK